jgi:hypothetical protein
MWPYTFGHMTTTKADKKLKTNYLVRWTNPRTKQVETKVYVRRAYAVSFHIGVAMGTKEHDIIAFSVGDTVALTPSARRSHKCPKGRRNNTTATIRAFMSEFKGGVFLDRDLHGCRYWNIEDMVKPI